MSEWPPLRDYSRSLAVVMGTWDYDFMPHVPAAANSLQRMVGLLTGPLCGWPQERLLVLSNEHGPGDLPDNLITALEEISDVALFYYVGHGLIAPDDELCLGLMRTRVEANRRGATSLRFGEVRRALLGSQAATKIVILDCCFAGLATATLGAQSDVLDLTAGTGAYTMTATSAYTTAWYESGPQLINPQTYFTKYLADLIEEGIPGQPAALRIDPIFRQLCENLAADNRPIPSRRSVNDASQFVFAHNAAPAGSRDFFVSYSQADRAWAEWVAWVLEEEGHQVLIQAWDFMPGSNWIRSMDAGMRQSKQTIAILSDTYLRSSYGTAEWQSAWASDPSGTSRGLLAVRIADCDRPGLLDGVASIDLFGVTEATARARLRDLAGGVRSGRAKPTAAPAFPERPTTPHEQLSGAPTAPAVSTSLSVPPPVAEARVWEVVKVFQPTGVPEVTFVQPEWFAEFLMALRQPGLSVVLEGPSGAGKTTLLQHAIEQGARRLRQPRMLTARDPADVAAIARLVSGGDYLGITAIDDFHRLPSDLQARVVDYLKLLADRGDETCKLVIVGIPQTAQSLVRVSFDVANRIREFRLGWAQDRQVLGLVEQGESALNIKFDDKSALLAAAGGSLITAQSLCWHLVGLARIEETLPEQVAVPTDIGRARESVFRELRLKYHAAVAEFASLDGRAESACIDLLLALAAESDGVLYLDSYAGDHGGEVAVVASVLARLADLVGAPRETISRILYYDPKGRRLIADDPQFIFYIRHLDRNELMQEAGKRLPPRRHRVFVCYSHANAAWMKRLLVHLGPLYKDNLVDLWSDERIRPGDDWRSEIDAALATARFAVLLVSADFYNSVFIRDVELPSLLAASDSGGCKVIPLLVSASRFPSDPALSRFQAANRDGRTLSGMTAEEAEQVLSSLAAAIEEKIRNLI